MPHPTEPCQAKPYPGPRPVLKHHPATTGCRSTRSPDLWVQPPPVGEAPLGGQQSLCLARENTPAGKPSAVASEQPLLQKMAVGAMANRPSEVDEAGRIPRRRAGEEFVPPRFHAARDAQDLRGVDCGGDHHDADIHISGGPSNTRKKVQGGDLKQTLWAWPFLSHQNPTARLGDRPSRCPMARKL